jgi:hypothetical protein
VAELVRGAEPGEAPAPRPGGEERWRRLYFLVLGVLAVEIAALWVLARVFR